MNRNEVSGDQAPQSPKQPSTNTTLSQKAGKAEELNTAPITKPPLFFRLVPVFLGILVLLISAYLALDYFEPKLPFELPVEIIKERQAVNNYEECVNTPGSRIQESYPATCVAPGGLRFIQPTPTPTPSPATDPQTSTSAHQEALSFLNSSNWQIKAVANELAFFAGTKDVRLPGTLYISQSDKPWEKNINTEVEFISQLKQKGWQEEAALNGSTYKPVIADGPRGSTTGLLYQSAQSIQALWLESSPDGYHLFVSKPYQF